MISKIAFLFKSPIDKGLDPVRPPPRRVEIPMGYPDPVSTAKMCSDSSLMILLDEADANLRKGYANPVMDTYFRFASTVYFLETQKRGLLVEYRSYGMHSPSTGNYLGAL